MHVSTIRKGLVALALGASASAYAAPLISNLPNQVYGVNMSFAQVADNFTIAGTGTYSITSIDFWSIQEVAGDYRGTISWTIFNDAGGSIGSVHEGGVASPLVTATGNLIDFGVGEYAEYEFNIPVVINLTAGVGYWLALHNGALTEIETTEMLWESSSTGAAPVGRYNDLGDAPDQGWIDTDLQLAFRLIGTRDGDPPPPSDVPEPSTLALLFGALVAARAMRRTSLAN